MNSLFRDFRHALRLYRRTPGSSLIAVIVLAIGMAFVSAFVSLYVDLVIKPHPGFEDSGRLVTVGQTDGTSITGFSLDMIDRMSDEMNSLEAVAGVMPSSQRTEDGTGYVLVGLVSREFFPGLKPRLLRGRRFEYTDHAADAEPAVVLSYSYWQNELEGADVLGEILDVRLETTIWAGGADPSSEDEEEAPPEFRIIGILAPELQGVADWEIAFWLPVERALPLVVEGPADQIASALQNSFIPTYGRLAAGASTTAVGNEIRSRYADSIDEFRLEPGSRLDAIAGLVSNLRVMRESKRQLALFLAASVLLALVAAANVSLFLLARAPGRRRELGVRMVVGAPLGRLARQLASEAGLLVLAGALLGMLISVWLSGFLRGLAFLRRARFGDVTLLDWRVLSILVVFMALLTLAVSLAPILGLQRQGIAASSRHIAARATLAQRIAGTLQIAVAGALGGAALGFGWYLASLMLADPGYELKDRYLVSHTIDFADNGDDPDYGRFIELAAVESARRREAIEAIPGVEAVSFGEPVPGTGATSYSQTEDPLNPNQQIRINFATIDAQYIEILGLRLLYSRGPREGDGNVVLVNQALARRYFGRDDVVGEQLPVPSRGVTQNEIIGVLADLSFGHPAAEVEPFVFESQTGMLLTGTAVVRTQLTAARLQQELERIVSDGAIEIRVVDVRPLQTLRSNMLAPDRARGLLTVGTALLVFVLAGFGFYGTQRYLVAAGRREYAIRAALGANAEALGRLVYRRGLSLSLPGLCLGALLSFILVAWLRDDYLTREISPATITLGVIAILVLLLLIANLGPARQARKTLPAPLLRED